MIKIAIFASGSGTNAENLVNYFKDSEKIKVSLILTNNAKAGVLTRAQKLNVPALVFGKQTFNTGDELIKILKDNGVDWLILAGFLWLIPHKFIKAFPDKIINIHPALLPKYGGKGMWGHHVHNAVIDSKESESGITIHYVNEKYDEGKIIYQAKCPISPEDTAQSLAEKVHQLEYFYFPKIVEQEILSSVSRQQNISQDR